ncbi:MAG: YhjD/YihY/BrkB family envelope integrity protein [Streptosporangiaceae bacterium]
MIKKYGDDNGGTLAGSLAHSAFVSVFPLLLVMVTILGLISSFDPALRGQVTTAVTSQFPMVGKQLAGNVHALRRSSVIGLIVGLLGLIWGTTGLAQSGLFTMSQV